MSFQTSLCDMLHIPAAPARDPKAMRLLCMVGRDGEMVVIYSGLELPASMQLVLMPHPLPAAAMMRQ